MGLGIGFLFVVLFLIVFGLVLVPLAFHIWAIVDVATTPDEWFGPPWDNTKNAWLLGLAIAFVIPAGHIIAPILWWVQVRGPKSRGEPPARPFWAGTPRPAPPPGGYPPAGDAPPYPGAMPPGTAAEGPEAAAPGGPSGG